MIFNEWHCISHVKFFLLYVLGWSERKLWIVLLDAKQPVFLWPQDTISYSDVVDDVRETFGRLPRDMVPSPRRISERLQGRGISFERMFSGMSCILLLRRKV